MKPYAAIGLIALSALLFGNAVHAAPATFAHPGILMSDKHLERIWLLETDRANPFTRNAYYRTVAAYSVEFPDNNENYQPHAMAYVPVTPRTATPEKILFNQDMNVAYYNAVRWAKTGKPEYRDISIRIMNAWATTFKSFKSDGVEGNAAQTQLVAAWAVPVWANTAEIIRHHKIKYGKNGQSKHTNRPWSKAEIDTFTKFLTTMHKQIGHGPFFSKNARLRNNNWGASAALADMSFGVFTDNATIYRQGVKRMSQLIPDLVARDGEVYELRSRDCAHPQYTLASFTQAAQIELNQNNSTLRDLTREGKSPLIARSIEYMSRAITDGSPARNCTNTALREGYARIALRIYETERNTAMPNLKKALLKTAPLASSMFTNYTAITHGGNTLDGK